MTALKLDEIDRKILAILQKEGRITNVELAERVGISAPPCLRRVRALEDAGYITAYHAVLAGDKLGYPLTIFALVGLSSHSQADVTQFQERVAGWPNVRRCWMLAGDADYLLQIVARDWNDYQDFLTNALIPTPNVTHVKTLPGVRPIKEEPGAPVV